MKRRKSKQNHVRRAAHRAARLLSFAVFAVGLHAAAEIGGHAHVMMQGFYWDCPEDWYGTMAAKASELRDMKGGWGIDRIWFPAPQKSNSGRHSMGYDPYDYYDLGQYDQKGTVPTRFGTQKELKETIEVYQSKGIACMADVILNHRLGGAEESNPNLGGQKTWTDFSGVASGKCTWNYDQFHPSSYAQFDAGPFKDFPDICHVTGRSEGAAGYDLIQWGKWLTDPANAGFDGGWRLDFVKGVNPSYLKEFIQGTGNPYSILECWDDIPMIEKYIERSACGGAFDFPAFYTMGRVFNHRMHIGQLVDPSQVLAAGDPEHAVTFVANHDTDKDAHVESVENNIMLAYAFILTYQGYPCIFWKDYFNSGMADLGGQPGNGIDSLVWVRGELAGGDPDIQVLKDDDNDLLVYGTTNGSFFVPGYIAAINNHPDEVRRATVQTPDSFFWNKTLVGHAWYSYLGVHNSQPDEIQCDSAGNLTLEVPPRGYVVYSIDKGIPEPWSERDVGQVGRAGSTLYSDGTFIVTGSDDRLSGRKDAFHYVARDAAGDVTVSARVSRLDGSHPLSRSGVMIRDGWNAAAPNAAVMVSSGNGIFFQWRAEKNGKTQAAIVQDAAVPCWVGLRRRGNLCRAFYSTDGTQWRPIGEARKINLAKNATVGLAVTSHDHRELALSVIDNLSVTSPAEQAAPKD